MGHCYLAGGCTNTFTLQARDAEGCNDGGWSRQSLKGGLVTSVALLHILISTRAWLVGALPYCQCTGNVQQCSSWTRQIDSLMFVSGGYLGNSVDVIGSG